MLNFTSPITESHTYNNFSMKEKSPIIKLNLRGNTANKDFVSSIGKILGIILPLEVGNVVNNESISVITLGPNEWLIISNDIVNKTNNNF